MHTVGKDWRSKLNINMFDPRQFNIESYHTDIHQKKEMKHSFGEELLNNLHLFPDPLKKNLADSILTTEEVKQKNRDKNFLNTITEAETPKMGNSESQSHNYSPAFGGLSSFFSGLVSVISGAMANLRPKSPVQYYDCFDEAAQQGPPPTWHRSNDEVQNKSAYEIHLNSKSDMNIDRKTAAAQCEDKLNKVRLLLTTKPIEAPKFRSRRPKKVFVEPGSVEESFEDAFSSEDFVRIANNSYIEYYGPYQIHHEDLSSTAPSKVKTERNYNEYSDIVETPAEVPVKCEEISKELENMVKEKIEAQVVVNNKIEVEQEDNTSRQELVTSCEDKLSKLKALLQEKRKKNTIALPSPDSSLETVTTKQAKPPKIETTKDKRYKNPCRKTDKRKKTKMRKSIQDDLLFAHEINSEHLSSVENSPIEKLSGTVNPLNREINTSNGSVEYFDEVSGRFRSTSTTESEDSFQIVFSDSPKNTRMRQISDCDSEDSFIVFEESPDSCYTSNDVFGDTEESGSDDNESESELSHTDDVQVSNISHTLSRTLSDLTDGSLYQDEELDEVDCAVRSVCDEIPSQELLDLSDKVIEPESTGLLLNETRKMEKRKLPPKSVHFSTNPPKVHMMRVWAFAARQARAGHWERCALDRDRFKRRIADVDMAVSWVLKPQHRSRVMFQRFMPWWNAQKRKELAEKKAREEKIKEEMEEAEGLKQENDGKDKLADIVSINDKEQKQINERDVNVVAVNDTSRIIVDDAVNDKLNNLKCNSFVNKNDVNNKSMLNDDSLNMKIVIVNDKQNDFTSKYRSERLSST